MRRVLVTGAASGIGEAIAARMESDGASVLAVDIDPKPDGPGEPFEADLTTREGNRAAVEAAVERFGGLDVVVANAGIQHVAPVDEFPENDWDRIISLLLTSPFLLARYAWGALREADNGRFIAIASAHALVASPYKAAYVAAKHGVVGLVKTLALEGADDGVLAMSWNGLSFTAAAEISGGAQAGRAMGMQNTLMRAAGAAVPLSLGALAAHGSWRATFLAMGVAPLAGRALLGPLVADEDRRRIERQARISARSNPSPSAPPLR